MSAETEQKLPLFTAHTPRYKKQVLLNVPMKEIEEFYEAELAKGIEHEDLPAIYLLPTGMLEDGMSNYIPGTPSTQGSYVYPSYALLKESDVIDKFLSLKRIPNWKQLFNVLEEQHNKKKYPIYLMTCDAQVQSAVSIIIATDLVRIFLDQKNQDQKQHDQNEKGKQKSDK